MGLEFPGGWGFWKIKKYEEMYEALLGFPEGWGGVRKSPFRRGGMDIFWNHTMFTCTVMCRHFFHQFNLGKLPKNDIKINFML